MSTQAGKRLLSIGGEFRWPRPDYAIAEAIAAIEVEASAAERARIAEAVRELRGYETPADIEYAAEGYVYDPAGVMRAAVLAIVNGEAS